MTTITTYESNEDDPSQNLLVLWLRKHFSVVNAYDSTARFFVMYNVPMKKDGEVLVPVDGKGMTLRARVPSTSLISRAISRSGIEQAGSSLGPRCSSSW